jgi:hypothetical protein
VKFNSGHNAPDHNEQPERQKEMDEAWRVVHEEHEHGPDYEHDKPYDDTQIQVARPVDSG